MAGLEYGQVIALAADLAAVGPKVDAGAKTAVENAAKAVEDMAKGLAPVQTGTLQSSISVSLGGLTATIDATAPYAGYQEYGTSIMAPHPYMGPAFESAGDKLATELARIPIGL